MPHREQVKRLFTQSLSLTLDERERLLRAEEAKDPDIARAVRELLEHHYNETLLKVQVSGQAPSARTSFWRSTILSWIFQGPGPWIAAIVLLGGGLGVGYWMRVTAASAIYRSAADRLGAVTDSEATALEEQLDLVRRSFVAASIEARQRLNELIRTPNARTRAAYAEIADLRIVNPGPHRVSAWFILLPSGRLLAASIGFEENATVSRWLSADLAALNRGELLLRFPGKDRALNSWPDQGQLLDRLVVLVPYRPERDANVAAIRAFVLDNFRASRQVTSGRFGTSGEVLLFNSEGVLLTPPRFAEDMVRWGVSPRAVGASKIAVMMRDPGRRLAETNGLHPVEDPLTWPGTRDIVSVQNRLEREGAASIRGELLEPFRDYRGEPVIGVWRWIPQFQVGVLTKVDQAEIQMPINQINTAFAGLTALAAAMALWSVASGVAMRGLHRRAQRGLVLGQYTLVEKIGEGGLGEVYFARHALLRRPAAIKILRRDRLNAAMIEQFEREVQAASQLRHPNTIEIFDFGRADDGNLYCVMEYLPGFDLGEWVKRAGPMPAPRVIHIARQICRSLREAHAAGLLHRDLKPANIMLCRLGGESDFAKLLDFGLAKRMSDSSAGQTAGWAVAGTPYYVAPERLAGKDGLDGRSDIYSLGVLLYHLLTGQIPFHRGPGWVEATLNHTPIPVTSQGVAVPALLAVLVMQCLDRDPAQRPATASALLDQLDRLATEFVWTSADAEAAWAQAFPEGPRPPIPNAPMSL